jgi:gliding motility-associated-like protein
MKKRQLYIIVILLCFPFHSAFSQADCVTDPPSPPVLTSVTVQPETGNTLFTWTLSPSSGIAAYILYSYKNGDGLAIDTIWDPAATSYSLSSTATKYFSVSYVVAAMRMPRCTSIFSNVLTSIFEGATIDTCLKKIIVSWNSYSSVPIKVNSYTVLFSINGGNYTATQEFDAAVTSFTLNDFDINVEYCFIVHANLDGGAFSSSNRSCLSTGMQRPPQWINADGASVNSDGKVDLSFTIDPLSEIRHFRLERKSGPDDQFQQISEPTSVNGSVIYTDNQANTNTINYYRLSAINSCNLPVMVSNIASNIVLSSEMSGNDIVLKWNPYRTWLGDIESYKLFVNSGKGYEEKVVIAATDSIYVLGYKQIMYDISIEDVCFYLTSAERFNPYGISGQSKSSESCISLIEIITVPNLFTPDNDLKNDLFKPVLSFSPLEYHLIISNRPGKIIFETRDYLQEWDGTLRGDQQPEGVYIWFLKLTTPSGKVLSRTGTITLIRNR